MSYAPTMSTFRCFFAVTAFLIPFAQASASTVVEGVRAWAEADHTRIVLDLDGPVRHNLFTLRNPSRVVIDLAKGRFDAGATNLPANVGVVRNVRAAEQPDGSLRIVLDLDKAVQAKSFFAGPGAGTAERLVIDLGERAGPSPVKRASTQSKGRDIVIAVDPGHGGVDPGAVGKNKTREKDVVMAISRKLVDKINAEPGLSAFLVRKRDLKIDHWERMERARRANADLFVSVHADAVEDRRAYGSSVYALSLKGASDEAARRLANRENAALIGDVQLRDKEPVLASVLMDLSQNATINASIDIGEAVLKRMGRVNRLHRRTVQQAGFIVLKSPDVPSILVETAYISNPDEERRLNDSAHQHRVADAVYQGIRDYYLVNPPVDSLFAQRASQGQIVAGPVTYTIAAGDTLSEIAERHRVSLRALRSENRIRGDRIRVGQVLRIPTGG